MKKFLCFLLLSIPTLYISAQQVYIETGAVISAFNYKNSEGEKINNLYGRNSFFLQAGYHTALSVKRLNFSAGISYAGYGAKGSDSTVGNYFDWDVEYIGVDLGLDYEIIRKRFTGNSINDLTVYIKTTLSPEFMVHGTHTINNDVYDLSGVEQFKYPFLFARGGAGVSYYVGRIFLIYLEYMGGMGFSFMGNDDNEKLMISSHNIGFGILINLPAYTSWRK